MKATISLLLSWLASQRYAIDPGCSQPEYRRGHNDALAAVERWVKEQLAVEGRPS